MKYFRTEFFYLSLLFIILSSCSDDSLNVGGPSYQAVFSEATINMDTGIISHISGVDVDNRIIHFDNSDEVQDFLEPGKILYSGEISELFPTGFIGRLTDVAIEVDGFSVKYEPASIEDAFDRLYINEYVDFELTSENPDISLYGYPVSPSASVDIYQYNDKEGFVGYSYALNYDSSLLGSSVSTSSSFKANSTVAARMLCFIDLAKGRDPYISYSLTVKNINELNWLLEVTRKESLKLINKELNSWKLSPVALPYGALVKVVLDPEIVLDFVVETNAKLRIEQEVRSDNGFVLGIEYKDREFKGNVRPLPPNSKLTCNDLQIDGYIFTGFRLLYQVSLMGTDTFKCSAGVSIGPKISGDISFDTTELPYETLRDSKIKASLLSVSADINGVYAGKELSTINIAETETGTVEYFFLPEFSDLSVDVDKESGSVSANISVLRKMIVDREVGLAVFKGNELFSKGKTSTFAKDEEILYLNDIFTGLEYGEKYTLCPYVLFDNRVMRAFPEVDFTLEEGPETPDDSEDPDNPIIKGDPIPFVGRWKVVERYADGKTFDWPYDEWYEFSADGTFIYTYEHPGGEITSYEYYLIYDKDKNTLTHIDYENCSAHVDYYSPAEIRLSYSDFMTSSFENASTNTIVLK